MSTDDNASNANRPLSGIIHAVSIKLPEFWTKMPAIWFLQVESQFSTRNIVSEETKFHHVVQSLPQDVAASVYDILTQQSQTPYTNLKKALIDRHSMSESRRIEALLSGEEMGDKKPSEFFRRLQTLAGQSMIVTESLILELWKRRLPTLVQVSIKSSSKTKTDELLEIADDIFEVYKKQDSCFSNPSHSERSINELTTINQNLQSEISEIKNILSNLNLDKRSSRSQNRIPFHQQHSRSRNSHYRSNSRNSSQLCWFHNRYGKRALKCSQPCNFKKNNPN